MRGRQPEERLPRAQAHHQRGHHQPQDPEAARGELLPRGPDRALLARRPRRGRRRVRDGGQRRVRQEGEARGAVHGHGPHERQPGVEDVLLARRRGRRPAGTRPLRRQAPLRLARRHLHQVQGRRPRAVRRARRRHRRGFGRLQAPAGARRRRRRALRRPEGLPALAAGRAASRASPASPATRTRASSAPSRRRSRPPRGRDASSA